MLLRFWIIGLGCAGLFTAAYGTLRGLHLPPLPALALAQVIAAGANFLANRRWTFARHQTSLRVQLVGFCAVTGAGLILSSVLLTIARTAAAHPAGALDVLLAVSASVVPSLLRFALLRRWVFGA